MKSVVLVTLLVGIAFAQLPDKPIKSYFGCDCEFTRVYRQSCSSMYDTLSSEIGAWQNGSPDGGAYTIGASGQDSTTKQYYLVGSKLGNGSQDWMYIMSDYQTDYCSVNAISVGNNWCFYDFGNNYCTIEEPVGFFSFEENVWNGCRATSDNCTG